MRVGRGEKVRAGEVSAGVLHRLLLRVPREASNAMIMTSTKQ